MKAKIRSNNEFYEYAESMKADESYMLRMNTEDVAKALSEVSETDKEDLKNLLQHCIGEQARYMILPSDTRAVTFFFHPGSPTHVNVEGVRLASYPDKTEFTVAKGNWKLELHTIKEWQRGKWCVEQDTVLLYKDVRVALFANDTLLFKGDYVISPVTKFADQLAAYTSSVCEKTQLEAFTAEDFACMAACGVPRQQFCRKVDDGEKKVEKLTELFMELNMIDLETAFTF